MCGIFGVINKKIDEELGYRCVDRLAHRGPDSRGLFLEKDICLGHRRLGIMDPSENGKQPMTYENDRYVIVFNGEIFNFIEIRNELIKDGFTFESDSDSEVLLAAFVKWKEQCLDRFNGMWAFIILDRKTEKLFISRDRFGVKPLFYCYPDGEDKNAIAFGSEMKAITPLMKEIRPNRKIVTDPSRTVYYESTDECVIEGIRRFPAGCYAWADKNGMEIKRFWNTLDNLIELPESYEEQVEMFRELFLNACALRMRSDVTVGTALSGGLDSSSTICAMAHIAQKNDLARINHDWQHAYVASFPGTTMDETVYAKRVTDHLGINNTFVEINPEKAIDRLGDFIWLFEDVYLTSPIPMMMLYGALKKDGTTVTIDGHGADELFGGYTFDFIHALDDTKTKEERNLVLDAYIESFPKNGSNISLKNSSRTAVYFNYKKRRLKDRLRSRTEDYKKVRAADDERYKKMDTLNRILYVSSHESILPTLLRNYDRYSMANSVEIRMPFMDYRIVTFALSLPWKSKLHGGYSKSIIRDAMAPFMPEDIAYRRTKIGFNSPIVEWMKGPLRDFFTDIISSSSFLNCDLIDPKSVSEKVTRVISDEGATFAMGEQAWSSLYPFLWESNVLKRL